MLIKTQAIVLSKIKYRDYDLIVRCYTKHKGITSYMLHGVLKGKKGYAKTAYFQLLSQLQIEELYKPMQTLQGIKEVRLNYAYKSLHTNVYKSAIVIFLSEVLSIILKEEEKNEALFHYLETTLQWLDIEVDFSNFHLLFLLNLTKHLGFYPDISDVNKTFFNVKNNAFNIKNEEFQTVSEENLKLLKQLLGTKFDTLHSIKISSNQRQSFLNMLLLYFELHLGDFKKPKSLQIFNQVFG